MMYRRIIKPNIIMFKYPKGFVNIKSNKEMIDKLNEIIKEQEIGNYQYLITLMITVSVIYHI